MMVLFLWLMVFVIGFAVGALTILGAEAVGVYVFINRLTEKNLKKQAQISQHSSRDLDPLQSLDFVSKKQGALWVLESEKVSKNLLDKGLKEQKRKKDFLEVSPVKKHAKLKDQKLILVESDGSQIAIDLKGCIVEAVSATNLSSGKWAKRFPIKLESKSSVIYNGSKTLYFYLETSWEKESWCKALRLASCDKKDWFSKLQKEFHNYLTNAGYPSFMKPSIGFSSETVDRTNRSDGTSSKVRLFLKKIAKKTARVGQENKSTLSSLPCRVERREIEKIRPFQETVSATGLVNAAPSVKRSKSEENMVESSSLPTISNSGSQSHISVISDVDSDDKFCNDEGTLCWNFLISRFFFDLKSNTEMKRSIQSRVQRTLSNMRTPSYIGDVICNDIDLGNLPPYIHGMRILPMDMNEVWMLEVDIEYSGGALLDIETRVEVHELDLQKGIVESDTGSGSVGDVSSDLLEGLEYYGKQLNLSEGTVDERKEEGDPSSDGLKSGKSTVSVSTHGSRWKSILIAIARQVSQVPLSLAIRVTSLRGTLRLHIKPPPSDQLWFAFTCMPDIDFSLESSIGEHKITNGHIALFLVNRLKASIKESLVLPNSECVCMPWMISEKDDWVPRKVAPFLWLNQEANNGPTTVRESTTSHPSEGKTKTEASKGISSDPESKHQKPKSPTSTSESSDGLAISTSSTNLLSHSRTLQELSIPLLGNDEPQESCKQAEELPSGSMILYEKQDSTTDDDDLKPKRMGRRARMFDLGKKVGEKFEEKRRHIEEKGRHIVEKMRGP